MSNLITVVPAYGRDYTDGAKAIIDWNEGKDFRIQSVGHPYDGSYCSIRDGINVAIRYNKLEQIAIPV